LMKGVSALILAFKRDDRQHMRTKSGGDQCLRFKPPCLIDSSLPSI